MKSRRSAPPSSRINTCSSYLADKQMLLVLDNYEHLLSGPENDRRDGYGLVTKLVAAAPEVKLLITSRSRLNVTPEWSATVEGLEVPGTSTPLAPSAT